MWRGGCIIRSAFLGKIKEAFDRDPKLANLLLDPYFRGEIDALPARLATRGCARGGRPRHSPAGDDLGPGLLRRLPHANGCRPTCCRPSATTSAPIPTSASTGPAASSSTPTGPAAAARPRRRPTTCERRPRRLGDQLDTNPTRRRGSHLSQTTQSPDMSAEPPRLRVGLVFFSRRCKFTT